jgi:hypothetical protein
VRSHAARFLRAFRQYAAMTPAAARSAGVPAAQLRPERLAWGMTQPLLAVRLLLAQRDLARAALIPPFWLAVACAALALTEAHDPVRFLKRFYLTFAALAPLPTLVFARHYARFAARVHTRFGFGECQPHIEPLGTSIRRVVHGFLMLSIAPIILLAPLAVVRAFAPVRGPLEVISAALAGAWALHWIIVDALDSAQVTVPGRPPAHPQAPWFVRATRPVRALSRVLHRYSRFWREEIELIERHRLAAIGLGLATAALLATPGLNLLFRPITIAAAVHFSAAIQQPPVAE